jgi:hypothetical protein
MQCFLISRELTAVSLVESLMKKLEELEVDSTVD